MNRPLLFGLWATALFWPFVHSGGYSDAFLLALTPLVLALGEAWPHWSLRVLHWLAALYLELCAAWGSWVTLGPLDKAIHRAFHEFVTTPLSRWTQIGAHSSAPFILIVFLAGWLIFRACQSYDRALVLMVIGVVVIGVGHGLWGLEGEYPLASFLIVGLLVLARLHQLESGGFATKVSRPSLVNGLAALVVIAPIVVGFQVPSYPALDPARFLTSFEGGTVVTGFGPGIAEVDHSLVASDAPVFVAKADAPYYWQGGTYNTFNGLSWSNTGPSSRSFDELAGGNGLPIVSPYFEGSRDVQVSATIIDVSSHPLTTLFYTGAPIAFSVPVTVHPISNRFDATGVKRYHLTALEPLYDSQNLAKLPYSASPSSLSVDLGMPANLSPRVKGLAESIVTGTNGPFSAASAITRYLDTHYRYSYHIHPAAHNVVNQFLFVSHEGYCDQFATSFIMMMRSLGVPARYVVGYAPGSYDKARGGYLIRQVDAHAWAEFWIKGAGWIPVDPTPGFRFPMTTASGVARLATARVHTPRLPKFVSVPTSPLNTHVHLRKIPITGRSASAHRNASADGFALPTLVLVALFGVAFLVWRRRTSYESAPVRQWADMQRVSRNSFGADWDSRSPREWGEQWVSRFPIDDSTVGPMVHLLETSFYSGESLTQEQEAELARLWITLRGRAQRIRRSMRV